MRIVFIFIFFISSLFSAFAQNGFKIEKNKNRIVIPFQLINNLIFIPLELNGEKLTFLLDTGVEQTVLFSLDESNQVSINEVEAIKLKGLGSSDAINGYKSKNNEIRIKKFVDKNHLIYIVLDQEFNFSSHVGIPVNGIIGYHFFKNHLVEINYDKKKICIYTNSKEKYRERIKRKYRKDSISIELKKPYINAKVHYSTKVVDSKLLLDTGNSDAIWLFEEGAILPEKIIDDFIGRGFSGDVFGKRGRIKGLEFSNHFFNMPITTFPDSTSLKSVNFVEKRVGSIGGEILSRFTVAFDYTNNTIYTLPNSRIVNPFEFNMSGIEVEHSGLEWVDDSYQKTISGIKISFEKTSFDTTEDNLQVRFKLKPVFTIASVRKNSEAEKAGLQKNDKIIKINGTSAHNLNIQKIRQLLKSEDGKKIEIEFERDSKVKKTEFRLKKIL